MLFRDKEIYDDMYDMAQCINRWANRCIDLLRFICEDKERIDALEKEIEQLKKGKKNEKVLSGKETRKKQSRSKTGKLYKLYGV